MTLVAPDQVGVGSDPQATPVVIDDTPDHHALDGELQVDRLERGEADRFEIFTHGGRNATGIDAVEFAQLMVAKGAGEILLTSMDRDGTKDGYNLPLTRAIADAVSVPVIASGGAGTLDHLVEAVEIGHASAVLAASIFHFGTYTVAEAKQHMAQNGIPMRQMI